MQVEAFLQAIDVSWRASRKDCIRLHIIGSTALMLQTTMTRGTKDSDVLEAQLGEDARVALFLGVDETEIELPGWV